jgi:hypothetical protein
MEPGNHLIAYSDDELLRLLTQNNKDAFATIYDRYATDLYFYIKQIVLTRTSGSKAQKDTQMILIDIFAALLNNRSTLPPSFVLADYMFSSAYHRAVNYVCCKQEVRFN